MDLSTLMPFLSNILGGGNANQQNNANINQTIPQDVLSSYPTTILSNSKPQQATTKPISDNLSQTINPQNLLLSMLKGSLTNNTAQNNQMPNLDIIKNLLPLMQNNGKKNSPPKFSELKSIDEYVFD